MNRHQIRLVTIKDQPGVTKEYPYAVQIAPVHAEWTDGAGWLTVARYKTDSQAIMAAKDLHKFIRFNVSIQPNAILWKEQI